MSATAEAGAVVRVLSWNVQHRPRWRPTHDWRRRRRWIGRLLPALHIDLACMQELDAPMVHDLDAVLGDYAWVGYGRHDGSMRGEFAPLFYRRSRFRVLAAHQHWYSPTPGRPSRGWDAAAPRVLLNTVLHDRQLGRTLHVLNTHLDHRGPVSRQRAIDAILAHAAALDRRTPLLVAGDFNFDPGDAGYARLAAGLRDSRRCATTRRGPEHTWSAPVPVRRFSRRLDYLFVSGALAVGTQRHIAWPAHRRRVSDHLPVCASLRLAREEPR